MQTYTDINTGEVAIGKSNNILRCTALGSCIALVLVDKYENIGGIAHIMLPGVADNNALEPTKYAKNALDHLIQQLKSNGSSGKFEACIVGGGNVLKRKNDTICDANIQSVQNFLNLYQIPVLQNSTGGYERRSVKFLINERLVKYTVGDRKEDTLIQFKK